MLRLGEERDYSLSSFKVTVVLGSWIIIIIIIMIHYLPCSSCGKSGYVLSPSRLFYGLLLMSPLLTSIVLRLPFHSSSPICLPQSTLLSLSFWYPGEHNAWVWVVVHSKTWPCSCPCSPYHLVIFCLHPWTFSSLQYLLFYNPYWPVGLLIYVYSSCVYTRRHPASADISSIIWHGGLSYSKCCWNF